MKTTDIETKLANAITNEVPDILDDILSNCKARNENVIEIATHKRKSNQNNWLKSVCATAAAVVVLVGGYMGVGQYQTALAVDSVITLDVNPSVKLEVNENEKVLSAKGINEDGNSILSGLEQDGVTLKGKELDEAVNALVLAMVEEGYLSEENNSILVSVNNSDSGKSEEIKTQLLTCVNDALSENGIDGAILGQNFMDNEKISEIAEQYGISEGKAILIEKIIGNNPQLSYDNLAKLNIHDLSLLAEKWIDKMEGISMSGTPSNNGYISPENAIDSACINANITVGDAGEIGSSIQLEDGKLVYDVSVKIGNTEHNYVIDAKTGVIISSDSKQVDTGSGSNNQDNATNDVTDDVIDTVIDTVKDSVTDSVTDIIDDFADSAANSDSANSGNAGAASTETPNGQNTDNVEDIITDITNKISGAANQHP